MTVFWRTDPPTIVRYTIHIIVYIRPLGYTNWTNLHFKVYVYVVRRKLEQPSTFDECVWVIVLFCESVEGFFV